MQHPRKGQRQAPPAVRHINVADHFVAETVPEPFFSAMPFTKRNPRVAELARLRRNLLLRQKVARGGGPTAPLHGGRSSGMEGQPEDFAPALRVSAVFSKPNGAASS
eukprot:RCo012632